MESEVVNVAVLVVGLITTAAVLYWLYDDLWLEFEYESLHARKAVLGQAVITRFEIYDRVLIGPRENGEPAKMCSVALHLRDEEKERTVELLRNVKLRPSELSDWRVGMRRPMLYVPGLPQEARFVDPAALERRAQEASDGATPTHAATSVHFDDPLWVFNTQDAERWLLSAPGPNTPRVVVLDFSDPHRGEQPGPRDTIIDSAAMVIAEELRVRTAAHVVNTVATADETNKVIVLTSDRDARARSLAGEIAALDEPSIVVWGVAASASSMDVEVRVRWPDEGDDRHVFTAPVFAVADRLIAWLTENTATVRSEEPPPWYQPLPATALAAYADVLDSLQVQVLANARNEQIEPLSIKGHRECVDAAFADLDRDPALGELPQLVLATLLIGRYADDEGALDDDRRARCRALLERAVHTQQSPIVHLAPILLDSFVGPDAARARRDALQQTAAPGTPYARWLEALTFSDDDDNNEPEEEAS